MKIPTLVAVAATALLTLGACGNGSSSTGAQQPAGGTAGGGNAAHALSVSETSLGKVLVDGRGMTLYTLSADGQVTMPLEMQMWGDEFGSCTDRFGVHWMVNIAGDAVAG